MRDGRRGSLESGWRLPSSENEVRDLALPRSPADLLGRAVPDAWNGEVTGPPPALNSNPCVAAVPALAQAPNVKGWMGCAAGDAAGVGADAVKAGSWEVLGSLPGPEVVAPKGAPPDAGNSA